MSEHILCCYGWPEEMDCERCSVTCPCRLGKGGAGRCPKHLLKGVLYHARNHIMSLGNRGGASDRILEEIADALRCTRCYAQFGACGDGCPGDLP